LLRASEDVRFLGDARHGTDFVFLTGSFLSFAPINPSLSAELVHCNCGQNSGFAVDRSVRGRELDG